jgi:hypothetical protein
MKSTYEALKEAGVKELISIGGVGMVIAVGWVEG